MESAATPVWKAPETRAEMARALDETITILQGNLQLNAIGMRDCVKRLIFNSDGTEPDIDGKVVLPHTEINDIYRQLDKYADGNNMHAAPTQFEIAGQLSAIQSTYFR